MTMSRCYHGRATHEDLGFQVDMSSTNETELRETIRSVFRAPVERVELLAPLPVEK
jgi:hypothetical protein